MHFKLHKWCCALNYVSHIFHPALCFSALVTVLCGTSGSLPVTAICLHTFCLSSVSWLIRSFSLPNPSQSKQHSHSHPLMCRWTSFCLRKFWFNASELKSDNLSTIRPLSHWGDLLKRKETMVLFWLHQNLLEGLEGIDCIQVLTLHLHDPDPHPSPQELGTSFSFA